MYFAFCMVHYSDQPLHYIYINNKILYHNLTSVVPLEITMCLREDDGNASEVVG